MAWLATVNSTSMVHEIRNICTAFLGKLRYLLLNDHYYKGPLYALATI